MNFFRSVFSTEPDPDDDEGGATSPDHDDEPDETAAAASAAAAAAATMDFFKSVFSTSPDSGEEEEDQEEEEEERQPLVNQDQDQQSREAQEGEIEDGEEGEEEEEEDGVSTGAWGLGFGGLIKTIASRSETVIKDLEEFGHGLKAESAVLRDVASRALDVGASAAQEKLETMGQAVDDLGDTIRRGTVEIISQSKEALLSMDAPSPSDSASDTDSNSRPSSAASTLPIISRYTRFEAQLIAARSDPATFAEPPEDPQDFAKWQSGFKLEENKDEIDALLKENTQVEVFLEKLVPSLVDEETFWSRYFYKIGKIKQAEDARAKIVKMAVAGDEEEDLSWEVEEEEEEEEKVHKEELVQKEGVKHDNVSEQDAHRELEVQDVKSGTSEGVEEKEIVETSKEQSNGDSNGEEMASKSSDFSVISSRPSAPGEEEEDLGWEAIEDVGESEDKRADLEDPGPSSGSASDNKAEDLRKRISATVDQEEEELSWDIEDE